MIYRILLPILIFYFFSSHLFSQGMVNVTEQQGLIALPQGLYGGGASFVDFDLGGDDDITYGTASNYVLSILKTLKANG